MFKYEKLGKKGSVIKKLDQLSIIFFTISFFGWCFEKIARYVVYNSTADRGFLSMPICPIYGVSVLLIYFLAGTPKTMTLSIPCSYESKKAKKFIVSLANFIIYFVLVTVISTLIEFVTGWFFKHVIGVQLWTYEQQPLNIGGYICLRYSLLWGILISLFMGILWDRIANPVKKIKDNTLRITSTVLWSVMICDVVFNCIYVAVTGNHFQFL